jgi:hypothetical protein
MRSAIYTKMAGIFVKSGVEKCSQYQIGKYFCQKWRREASLYQNGRKFYKKWYREALSIPKRQEILLKVV